MSDHGTQFVSNERNWCKNPVGSIFIEHLRELGIRHIKARVKQSTTTEDLI